jgi:hypothetical protein
MKNIILTAVFSALHILTFIIAREHFGMKSELNFLVFWAMLGLTWAAAFRVELKQ